MGYERFVFPGETSQLKTEEFARAVSLIDAVERMIEARGRMVAADPGAAAVILPDAGWHPDTQPSFELDGATRNMRTSWELVRRRDPEIVAKLRLYGQAFTGYQLATLAMASERPWIADKLPDDLDEIVRLLAGRPDQNVFDYVAVAGALPAPLRANPPHKFGEMGWLVDGAIVNYDTYACQERLCLLYENGVIDRLEERASANTPLLVVEIGGGYGALAHHLMRQFDARIRYVLVDLPESLAFAAIYLSTLFPDLDNALIEDEDAFAPPASPGFSFVPNTVHHAMALPRAADLVINTLSMSEMSDIQIEDYCRAAQSWLGTDGIFFEQNHQEPGQGPGGLFPSFFKNLRRCETRVLPDSYPARRGLANLWVNVGP